MLFYSNEKIISLLYGIFCAHIRARANTVLPNENFTDNMPDLVFAINKFILFSIIVKHCLFSKSIIADNKVAWGSYKVPLKNSFVLNIMNEKEQV